MIKNPLRFSPFDLDAQNDLWESFLDKKKEKMELFRKNNYEIDLQNYKETVLNVYKKMKENNKKIFLIYGMIQSGKTDFIIGSITKIFSESNSNLVFWFNQSNRNLLDQSFKRLEKNINSNLYTYQTLKDNLDEVINKLKNNENVIILSLKEIRHLQFNNLLTEKLNQQSISYNSYIFDDEGDVASFNDKNKEEGSRIFNNLKTLFNNSKRINFVSITATPYAHFIVEKNNFMNPDFIFFLPPSIGYVDINFFVNNFHNEGKIFHQINSIDKDEIDEIQYNNELEYSLHVFIIQCFWWKNIQKYNSKPRMLINIDRLKQNHEQIEIAINNILLKIKNRINIKNLSHICQNESFTFSFEEKDREALIKIIDEIKTIIFNGNINMSFDQSEDNYYHIIIGNKKLDRGLTIIDLINSFISFRSRIHANADYVLQQARFLGYREEYKNMIRIFLTRELIYDYIQINDNIINFIQIIENSNNDFSKIEKFIPLSNENDLYDYKLFPTRDSISNYEYVSNNGKIDFIKNKYFDSNDELDKNNFIFYEKFKKVKNKKFDTKNNEYIDFPSWTNFSNELFDTTNKEKLKNKLFEICFDKNNLYDLNVLNKIINDNSLSIVVRKLQENKRQINKSKTLNYFWIGKGNYAQNEKEFYLKGKTISIDIIPIHIKNEEEKINKLIYRTRIFINKEIEKDFVSGYKIKN